MALTRRGIAWLPTSLIAKDLAHGRLRPVGPPSRDVDVAVVLFRAAYGLGRAAEGFWGRLARSERPGRRVTGSEASSAL